MAILTFENAYFKVLTPSAVDLSDHITQIEFDPSPEMQDDSRMGYVAKCNRAGAGQYSLVITFQQDFGSSKVDALFGPWLLAGTALTWEMRPVNAAQSATNPTYAGQGIVGSYPPISGSWGQLMMARVSIVPNGGALPTRTAT